MELQEAMKNGGVSGSISRGMWRISFWRSDSGRRSGSRLCGGRAGGTSQDFQRGIYAVREVRAGFCVVDGRQKGGK